MNKKTVLQLNQLTRDFYTQSGTEFDQTRQHKWEGWDQILPFLPTGPEKKLCVDLGCGNGRWPRFLADHTTDQHWQYLGYDSDNFLLEKAALAAKALTPDVKLKSVDLIEALANEVTLSGYAPNSADILVAFGFMHHVPSFALRQSTLQLMAEWLRPGGVLVIAGWQFATDPRFDAKLVSPTTLGIELTELEAHDYILTWVGKTTQYRYCHFLTEAEMTDLTYQLPLTLKASFLADGHSHTLNRYWVWQKPEVATS